MRDHACKPVGYMKLRTCTETVFDDLICLPINFMLNAVKIVTFIITMNNAELAIYNKYGYLNYSTRVLHQYNYYYVSVYLLFLTFVVVFFSIAVDVVWFISLTILVPPGNPTVSHQTDDNNNDIDKIVHKTTARNGSI